MNVGKKGVILLAVLVGLSVVVFSPSLGISLIITSECEVSASGPGGSGPATAADGSTFAGYVSGFGGTVSGSWTHQTPCPANICDELDGALFAFCTAYCVAMDCDGVVPMATPMACQRILSNFKIHSGGSLPPCETCADTFVGNANELLCFLNGGKLGDIRGPGTWNGEPGYRFILQVHDEYPTGDTYDLMIYDPYDVVVLDTSGAIASGDIIVNIP